MNKSPNQNHKKQKPFPRRSKPENQNLGDSLRKRTGQGADGPPTLRYGPAGDSARPLWLGGLGMAGRFPSRPKTDCCFLGF